MKILFVNPTFYPAFYYGGPTTSNYELGRGLVEAGFSVDILTTNANGPKKLAVETNRIYDLGGMKVKYCKKDLGETFSLELFRILPGLIKSADVVYLVAVYSSTTIPTLYFAKKYNKPVLWAPRGSLQRFSKMRRYGLKLLWNYLCNAVKNENLYMHFTSELEANDSKGMIRHRKYFTVPNGTRIPTNYSIKRPLKKILYLGRIDPKKNIESLLEAIKLLDGEGYVLTIAGTGDKDYVKSIEALCEKLCITDRVRFIGHVSSQRKIDVFNESSFLILPSRRENFGNVIAEALAHYVPVITTRFTPWADIEKIGCGIITDLSPSSIAESIKKISNMPLSEMGQKGHQWISENFSWKTQIAKMENIFKQISEEHH